MQQYVIVVLVRACGLQMLMCDWVLRAASFAGQREHPDTSAGQDGTMQPGSVLL